MKTKPLYIETRIKCDLDTLWRYTQTPELHEQWDLRFSSINYIPKEDPEEPQKFLYSTKIGLGLVVNGFGESVATKTKHNGESTSVLKFWSESRISLIKEGSGYWKYIPGQNGIKFFTGYDYTPRWGYFGFLVDRFIFRPLMAWATAWSFDCLKNWIEKGIHPKQALRSYITFLLSIFTIGIIWMYHGLVPKILFPGTGEISLVKATGIFTGTEETIVFLSGIFEIVFGFVVLFIHKRWVHYFNIFLMLMLLIGAFTTSPATFLQPFNPFSINIAVISLSVAALLNIDFFPKASNCKTNP